MQTLFIQGFEEGGKKEWVNFDSGAFMNFCIEKFKIQHIKQDNYVVELWFLFFVQSKDMQSQNHLLLLFLFNSLVKLITSVLLN